MVLTRNHAPVLHVLTAGLLIATFGMAHAAPPPPDVADLRIEKTGPATATPGETLVYTLTVRNDGPGAARDVVVSDPTPSGLTLVSTGGACTAGFPCALGLLSPGESRVITATYTLGAAPGGTVVTNTAVVTTTSLDPDTTNNRATAVTVTVAAPPPPPTPPPPPPPPSTDVAVGKTASTMTPAVGATFDYVITVSNLGPATATGIVISEPLPAGVTYQGHVAATGTYTPGAASWSIPSLAVGASTALTLTVRADVAGALPNTATRTATDQPDSNPGNDSSTVIPVASTPSSAVTDVGVAKSVSPAQVLVGGTATFTVLVRNNGPLPATGVVVTDQLPTGLTFVSATATQGGYDASNGAWSVGALAVGQQEALSLVTTVTASGAITNLAVRTAQNEPDADPSNDSSGAVVNGVVSADIGVAKTAQPSTPVVVGGTVTFTVVARNYGPSPAPAVTIDDVLPTGLAFTSATPSTGTFDTTTGRWTIGALAVNASAALTITATTTTVGTIVNRAVVTGVGVADPNPANDQDTATVVVGNAPTPPPALRLSKVALRNYLPLGARAEYVITVTNDGPGVATNVQVLEQLPASLQLIEARPSQGSYVPGTNLWTVGTLSASQSATLFVAAQVTAPGRTRNIATIVGGNPDPGPGRGGAEVDIFTPPPGPADLEITQQAPSTAAPNGLLTIRLVSRNLGSNVALNPYITGIIPPGTTFVSSSPGSGGVCTVPGNPPPPDPSTGYPSLPGTVPPLTCTFPGLMQPGETRVLEFTVRVAPTTRTGQILWSCWWTWSETEDPYHANNVIDSYLFVNDGVAPVGDLTIQAIAYVDGAGGTTLPVPVGAPVPIRFSVTNLGPVTARGQYALILDEAGTLGVGRMTTPQGFVAPTSTTSAIWDTGPVAVGQTVSLDIDVTVQTTASVTLFAQRSAGQPGDPDATNERATITLDGYTATTGGRWVAVGDVDGVGAGEIITGAGRGETPQVHVLSGSGVDLGLRFFAYDRRFRGGVQVASCDVDGDGRDEIITAPGAGRTATIRVLSLVGGVVSEMVAFDAFEPTFLGGAFVACADVDGDGPAEVIVGAGAGRAPDVFVYAVGAGTVTQRAGFQAYEPAFRGGVRVAAGRYAGRPGWLGAFAIATTPGVGRAAEVRLWTAAGLPVQQVVVSGAVGGVMPTLGDANGDGRLDLVIAPDDGQPELLRVFDVDSGAVVAAAPAGVPGFAGGVRVAVGRLQGGPPAEMVLGSGPGTGPRVRVIRWPLGGAPTLRLDVAVLEVP